ncbi:MAG: hypothetical protein COB02_03735 [Candidatus Cloacimonadota bacterium]|nr:MAG: hypothetical protein COB02_03735 [Candidatus Cloacimonadota bacterium]
MDKYDNYIFDFDGTIATIDVDWISLKKKINTLCIQNEFRIEQKLNLKIDQLKAVDSNVFQIIKSFEQNSADVDFQEIKPIISFLKKLDVFYVVSNNLRSTVSIVLKKIGLFENCKKIVGIEDIKNSKPSCSAFEVLLPFLNKGKSIYIGDRETDLEFAKNSNIDFKYVRDFYDFG